MNRSLLLAAALLAATGLRAEGEPAAHLFPADRDGAPAPLAPLGEAQPERPRPIRDKVVQLKEAGITREDMQRIREALEVARGDEAVKAARQKADAAQEKLRGALRAYAEEHGVQPPDFPQKFRPDAKDKPELTPEQLAERKARKLQEPGARKPEVSPEKMAEIRKVMEGARNDPEVKAAFLEAREAGEALRAAVHAAVLRHDPSLAPLVEKLGDLREAFREEHPGVGLQKRFAPQGDKPDGPAVEKPRSPKLAAALEAASADPAVKAARKAAEEAKARLGEALKAYADAHGIVKPAKDDPEAMAAHREAMEAARNDPAVKAAFEQVRAAGQALHEATKAAVLKADPSLASEFEKPSPAKQPRGDKPAAPKKVGA